MNARIMVVMLVGLGLAPGQGAAQLTDSAATAGAARFIALLTAGDWAEAEQMVAPALCDRLGATQLETVWGQVRASLGEGSATRVRGVSAMDTMRAVELYGDFARDTVLLRVVLSPATEVVGFWVGPVPDAAPAETPAPPYADESKFREGEVRVGADPWLLPGTLSIPVQGGPHPAIVLVHGSGPHDRDETVGGTKVFRDLAWGLASRGIAVLRYEKRTKVHGAKMGAEVTVEEEVIEDALAALELVRAHPAVDADQVYIAGHSLGAQLAPEIARRDGSVAGAILLAAPARPIGEVMTEQLEYLAGLPQNAAPQAQAQLAAALEQVRLLTTGEAADTQMVMGAPASYFRDLARRDAVAEALRLDVPLLVLQGERDYQVTMSDFAIWNDALEDRSDTTLKSFPSLNHLFVAGSGPATPAEYARPGFVAEDVVTTIRQWVRTQSPE
ncbi:MAG TPA: alpha/beta fold hydrolase [Longimicrobiales bacterium]|nr:alpha/beta fold hydrolase [Longimicrobiales bacterium]